MERIYLISKAALICVDGHINLIWGERQLEGQTSYVVGLMSGTSLDGVDAALVKISDAQDYLQIDLVNYLSVPYSRELKEQLGELCIPELARIENISAMNMYLAEVFSEVTLTVIQQAGLTPSDILLVSSHGQTIFHQPDPIKIEGTEIISTLQIGDIAVLAERTGITAVGDFRTRDMAVGGSGAPLVPYADHMLYAKENYGRVLVNIGGISNITVLSKGAIAANVIAYDTGPGNMIIDAFVSWATAGRESFDRDGDIARRGMVDERWLDKLLDHPYFEQNYPKSTGREMFGVGFARKLWQEAESLYINQVDRIATVTALTAKTIAKEILTHGKTAYVKEVLISGGGRNNQTLFNSIQEYLPKDISVVGIEEYGMVADAKEAVIFALLGYQCFKKRTNNLPSATGASKEVVMGKIAW